MTGARAQPPAEPFFLKTGDGQRFCLFHPPAGGAAGPSLLYLHPFAEEMNKSRRMAALQSRALAAAGIGVLQLDLHGCGDSSGGFGEATWDSWKHDVAAARAWLARRCGPEVGLWGLRLGALLALDCAREQPPARLLLWQPVLSGSAFLTQFLRLRVAHDMLAAAGRSGVAQLRAQLAAGTPLEVAGYLLAPELAAAIDALEAPAWPAPACPVRWFEMLPAAGSGVSPAATRVADAWRAQGAALALQGVAGPSFWSSQEIEVAPALIEATVASQREASHV